VIINVTGGPDMSLLEVNEALTIIQESAHEDANIIFGAVVDPTLANKVKITVIATGFDHVRSERSTLGRAPSQTPVDMTAYSAQLRQEPASAIVQPRAASTPTITRRAAIEMPLAPRAAVGQNAGDVPAGDLALAGEFDLNLDLDVPAFLRRNEG
jgi:cell division protein FtsZ